MIVNEFYNTQGLGNQLWCYVVTRIIALSNGYEFGIMSPEKFRGIGLIDLDFGLNVEGEKSDTWSSKLPKGIQYYYKENLIRNEYGIDITPLDENLLHVKDNTKIDGHFQSMKYISNKKSEISQWLKIKDNKKIEAYSGDDITIIHFRGGDYRGSPANSLLPGLYYKNAMDYMKSINSNMKFYAVTDDYALGKFYFQDVAEVIGSTALGIKDENTASHHIGGLKDMDYAILNNANNVIMSNSTFAFWAAWTNPNVKNVIYPKYWFSFNNYDNFWSTGDMKISEWKSLDREGVIE